jgi:hypothetical protein
MATWCQYNATMISSNNVEKNKLAEVNASPFAVVLKLGLA